jgi:predicted amidohydrolase YtcJ
MSADLIVTNATIYTMDPTQPTATACAVRDGKFLAVGSAAEIAAHRGPNTEMLDLQGAPVLPGLTDAHIHFTYYALSLQQIPIFEVPTLDEMLQRVAAKAATTPPGQWLIGWGWNQTLWPEPRFPTRHDLDRVAPNHPVLLREKSGHSAVVNTVALRLAGLDGKTPNPAGGELLRDNNGALTGMLLEDPAISLVADIIPEATDEEIDAAVLAAQANAHRFGLVAVHDLDGKRGFGTFQRLRNRGQLKLRAVTHISMEQLPYALGVGLRAGLGDEWLRVGGLKLFADGALGPRTAAMIEPYENEPENYGITIVDKEEMLEMASKASAAGLPTVIHAIGDRANHDVLDVFAALRAQEAEAGIPRSQRRHRMEHVQVIHPNDLPRLAELDVIASVQPIHATQDMNNVDAFWGKRGELAYAFRALLDSGARLALGSDAPVETPNPFVGIHAAVTRRRANGYPNAEGWHPREKLTVAEAIAGYTTGAAYAESLETVMGSITPGKYADFIVIDRDLFTCDPMTIHETQVHRTVIGGETVYQRA